MISMDPPYNSTTMDHPYNSTLIWITPTISLLWITHTIVHSYGSPPLQISGRSRHHHARLRPHPAARPHNRTDSLAQGRYPKERDTRLHSRTSSLSPRSHTESSR